ncbi:MAG TPA: hypothetical protein VGO87_15055 [Acidimicrobiia bacterium]|jgi:hypothetical protein
MRLGRTPTPAVAALGLAALGLAGLGLAACAPGAVSALPPPPSTAPSRSTTTTPDLTGIALPGVPGRTTIPGVAMGPGHATLSGTVSGSGGPVGGATVEVQRLVGDASATARVTAGPDGRWSLPNILGGRYRVRAWRVPDQTMATPAILFLGGGENRTLGLGVQSFSGPVVTSAVAPNPPVANQPANLVVEVSNEAVDAQGVGRADPAAGVSAQLSGTGAWQVTSPNPTTTDRGGQVTWHLTCEAGGTQPLGVSVNGAAPVPIDVPACAG